MVQRTSSESLDGGHDGSASPRVWMLADDRPGNVNQALGLAEALGQPFAIKTVGYGQLARLPNWLLPANLTGLTPASRETLTPPWPDLVIGAGRRTARIGRWLKHQNPGTCLVQLMWPGSAEGFDLIAVPEHDRVPDDPVLMRTLGPPHRLTPERLERSVADIARHLATLPRPFVACLVGGSSKHVTFKPADACSLIEGAKALVDERGGSLLVTTSRRTGVACTEALEEVLEASGCPYWLHRWQPEGDNPYLGMLGSADAVVVSADSASMCAEACAPGRPVFLHTPEAGVPEKFELLHRRLSEYGCLRPLGTGWFAVETAPPNPAIAIADAIDKILQTQNDVKRSVSVASEASAP